MISAIKELYILCGDIQIPTEKHRLLLKWLQRWQNITFFVGTFNYQLKKTVQYWNDFRYEGTLHLLLGHSNPNWKSQVIIEMITKIDITLHSLWGHSITNWKRQFNIEMISDMKEPYIFCWDIQITTEIDSSVLKWLQRWQNLTFFVGTFKFRLKKQLSIEMISKITALYILCGDIQVSTKKKQFSIETISKMIEPCILCGDIKIPTEISLHHRNDFSYQGTLHPLWGHSNPNWKTQIIIEMITKMTDPYILCWDIQVSNERSLHLSLGHLKSNWKKQFSIQMISKMTEPYIICGTLKFQLKKTVQYWNDFKDYRALHPLIEDSDPNWEESLVLKWLQRWQNLAFFEGTFEFGLTEPHIFCWDIQIQLKNRNYYWNDYKDDSPLHSLLAHSSFNWKTLTFYFGTFKIQLEKTVQYPNDFKDDRTLHRLWGHSNSNWKRQFSIEMISKMTESYILCRNIQVHNEKDNSVCKMISKMTEPYIYRWDIQIKADWKVHPLLGHSNSNWKRQLIIEMISKMTENDILFGDIQIPTEKETSLSKWLQRWQKITSFVGHLNN